MTGASPSRIGLKPRYIVCEILYLLNFPLSKTYGIIFMVEFAYECSIKADPFLWSVTPSQNFCAASQRRNETWKRRSSIPMNLLKNKKLRLVNSMNNVTSDFYFVVHRSIRCLAELDRSHSDRWRTVQWLSFLAKKHTAGVVQYWRENVTDEEYLTWKISLDAKNCLVLLR